MVGFLGLDSMVKLLISLLFGGEEDWFCIFPLFAELVGVYSDQPEAGLCRYQGGAEPSSSHHCPPREYSNGGRVDEGQASEAVLLLARPRARPGLRTGQDSAV